MGLVAPTAVLVAATKLLVDRVDPAGGSTAMASYPSGHAAFTVVCLTGMVVLFSVQSRWWSWALVAVVAAAMAVSLLIIGLHWLSDVLGGVLIGLAVLGVFGAGTPRTRNRAPLPTSREFAPRE
jgi:undecaprenyl-diphosphatase